MKSEPAAADADRVDSPPPTPADALLAEYGLPEHAPVAQLRQLTLVAAALCGTATAVVNLLGDCFQHQVGAFGFDGGASPLAESMCAVALREPRLQHVPDARLEPAFVASPWVDGRLASVRFYASAPMVLPDGRTLGSLCVFSDQPGRLSDVQRGALAGLAGQAVALFEQSRQTRAAAAQAALFRLVAEGAADVLSRHRPDGTLLYASPSHATVLGRSPAAGSVTTFLDGIHPDDRPGRAAALAAVVEGRLDDVTVLARAQHADGGWRWLEARLAPILDEAGQVSEVHCAARDVTARLQAERRLAEYEQRYRGVVEQSPDAIVVHVAGRVVLVNPAAVSMLGATGPEQLVGRAVQGLIDPELAPQVQERIAAVLAGRPVPRMQQRLRRLDGSWVQVEIAAAAVQIDGRPGVQNVIRDVTEAVAARAALEAANDALARARDEAERRGALTAAVLDTVDVGVVACDADGALTMFNRAARELHGCAEDSGLDPSQWADRYDLYQEDGTTRLVPDQVPLLRALTDGRVQDATMVVAPTGRPARTVQCDGRSLRDSAGAPLGAVVAMRDVTEARARAQELLTARDQALAATRAKTAFLAAASHEIRTPLNGVLGTLELLAAGELPDRQAELVRIARESGAALLVLLNDVLDLSQAETTSVALEESEFSPYAVVTSVVDALTPLAQRKGLALELLTGQDRPLVGDARRLRQVLMNLVANAVKFTEGGSVRVELQLSPAPAPGDWRLRVSVSDTGAGIGADELERLFQPFVQGEQGERAGGTGLGLALSQQLVQLMGGRVHVRSAPGEGATFTVEVDLRAADGRAGPVGTPAPFAPVAEQRRLPAAAGSGRGLRVLVADDGEVNLLVAQALLALEGAEVVLARDGVEALEAVRSTPFDLVLLDNRMPRMSGVEAARAIRALPGPAARTRLVALTASAQDQDRSDFLAAGVQDVLLKPVSGAALRRALHEVVAPLVASPVT